MSSYTLLTIHRPTNCRPEVLEEVFSSLQGLIIFPAHPRIRPLLNFVPANVRVIEPQGYLKMLELEKNADLIVTDSGGVQREAYNFQKNCILLRDTNEWPECQSGHPHLLGKGKAYQKCVRHLRRLIT